MMVQYDQSGCIYVIARWNSSTKGIYNQEEEFWEFEFRNGDICDRTGSPRELSLTFTCNTEVEYLAETVNEDRGDCQYKFTIGSKYACITNTETCSDDGGNDGDDSGLSAGWIAIILFIVVFILYCIIGYFVTASRNKEGGMTDICDNIPNKEFWFKLPSLVMAGCSFTWDFCGALCCRMGRDTDDDDFEDIDDKQQSMLSETDNKDL